MNNSDPVRPGADLTCAVEAHVAVLRIERGPNNFFDRELINDLAATARRLADGGVRAIVLTSEGRHFCAGANFSKPSPTGDASAQHLYEAALELVTQPLPIVAAVQGAAIGGGLGLAMVADFRVAGPDARLAANFARLGLHHGFGLTVTLPRAIGNQHAADLLYTGRRVRPDEALAIGLVDRVTDGDPVPTAITWAHNIAQSAPLAVRSIRESMRADLVTSFAQATERERTEQEWLIATDDFREGVDATAARRNPKFVGR